MSGAVIWSAIDCSFPGAGAYVGLASCMQHYTVAGRLLPKRGQVYAGGSVAVRAGQRWPLVYFAVRDPSAVRVVPVRAARDAGRRHVILQFAFGHRPAPCPDEDSKVAPLALLRTHCDERLHGVFVLTVGLGPDAEFGFQRRAGLTRSGLEYGELCDTVHAYRPYADGRAGDGR